MDTLALGQEEWQSNWVTNIEPHPETVTVTLTQTDSDTGKSQLYTYLCM